MSEITTNPARTYESFMVPTFFEPWAKRLIEVVKPRAGERVLDIGCGTGVVARHVAPLVGDAGSVTGVDISPDMLAVAREVAESKGARIEWHEAPAEALPFPDGSFDLALSQLALMFFGDRAAALSEAHRVLRSGGRLALIVLQGLDRHPFYETLDDAIRSRLGESGVEDIFSMGDADALRGLIAGAGFTDVRVEPSSLTARFPNPEGFLAGEIDVDTAAVPSMQHLDTEARRRLTEEIRAGMADALRGVTRDGEVVLEYHAYIGQATRA